MKYLFLLHSLLFHFDKFNFSKNLDKHLPFVKLISIIYVNMYLVYAIYCFEVQICFLLKTLSVAESM